jgi:hypothetical protein
MTPIQSAIFSELEQLLAASGLADLGPRQRPEALPLDNLNQRIDSLLSKAGLPVRLQSLVHGTLLLWNDHLDAAHSIAQDIEDADGSLLHAMMHRREPDYWNAKYWFRRAGKHPCYSNLSQRVKALLNPKDAKLAAKIMPDGVWDPCAFVDVCEQAAQGRIDEAHKKSLQEIQRIEFVSFLGHLCHP